jgi:hypothetical protein
MAPNYDHATLFVEPSVSASDKAGSQPRQVAGHEAETMRRLRHPFAVPNQPTTAA